MIGDRTVDEVITIGRQDIEVSVLSRMQEFAKRISSASAWIRCS